ncbi:MAG: hypothetical protein AB8B87_11750 [Granulosicoccus sp.]
MKTRHSLWDNLNEKKNFLILKLPLSISAVLNRFCKYTPPTRKNSLQLKLEVTAWYLHKNIVAWTGFGASTETVGTMMTIPFARSSDHHDIITHLLQSLPNQLKTR